ncbi:MAG TPA: hypothetical protein VGD80_43925 [Kofleriaceae bacterium]
MATFSFNGRVSATLSIRGIPYTLVATADMSSSTGGGGGGGGDGGSRELHLAYHASFDDSAQVGTIGEIFQDLASLGTLTLGGTQLLASAASGAANNPLTLANGMLDSAKQLPGFAALVNAVRSDTTMVRITDLELLLVAPRDAVLTLERGELTVGLGLDFRNNPSAKLLSIKLDTIALLVKFGVTS